MHGFRGALASGKEKAEDVDGGDDSNSGGDDRGTTTADRLSRLSEGGGVSGTAHDGMQSAGAGLVTNPTTAVTGGALDGCGPS